MKKFLFVFILLFGFTYADPIETTGNILVYAIPASTVGIIAYHKDWQGLKQYGLSLLIDEGLTFGLKYLVHELRPNKYDYHSFPSGHSSTTFCSSEFLWKRYGWQVGLPFYTLAAFTGYSRIESKWHYPHDVLAGATIGISCGYVFTSKK
jgi:membrane-associated phospholipid phosphatase